MRIGQLAKAAGVSVQTIRFYERRGLLRSPQRTASGYRIYVATDLESLRFIKWCQPMGFTLRELSELLQLHAAVANRDAAARMPRTKEMASIVRIGEQKLASIEEKTRLLQKMRRQLRAMIVQLQGAQQPTCPASGQGNPSRRSKR
jgi:MerR family copper efflux transcriptional regulator